MVSVLWELQLLEEYLAATRVGAGLKALSRLLSRQASAPTIHFGISDGRLAADFGRDVRNLIESVWLQY
jgi:hypothetical protein